MRKITFLLTLLIIFTLNIQAQVTIGSDQEPHKNALLDIKENPDGSSNKGIILPRVALTSTLDFFGNTTGHQEGMTVYNTATSGTSVDVADRVSPGFYYNNGTRWERLNLGYTNWFYMPSIPIKTSEDLTTQSLDLYSEYKKQFSGASGNFAKSTDAPTIIPYFPAPTDLYYYVTDFDPAVFSNISIDNSGVMTYDVMASATDYSFINIVFVLR